MSRPCAPDDGIFQCITAPKSGSPATSTTTMIVTHSHITKTPQDLGQAVADIFRLNRQGKVVEHWDVIQDVPATSANDNTMF